jgi:peptidoglycan/LPS O-acetylase OafA/YrhL
MHRMTPDSSQKNHAFELYRATAVMLVVMGHYMAAAPGIPSAMRTAVTSVTQFGVSIFFIISGYLLSASLMSHLRRKPGTSVALQHFYLRRVFRIYPAYLISLALLSALLDADLADVALHSLNLHNLFADSHRSINPVYWTLAVEFQWYLIAPALILFLARSGWPAAMGTLLLAVGVSVATRYHYLNLYFGRDIDLDRLILLAHDQLHIHLFNFLIGILLYNWRDRQLPYPLAVLALSLPALVVCGYQLNDVLPALIARDPSLKHQFLVYYPACLLLGLIMFAGLRLRLGGRILQIVSFVSLISYSLYIYHHPLLDYLAAFEFGWASLLLLYLGVSFLVSALSYHLIEAPGMRYSRRLLQRMEA